MDKVKKYANDACHEGAYIGCFPNPNGGCSCEVTSLCDKRDGINCWKCDEVEQCRQNCTECGLSHPLSSFQIHNGYQSFISKYPNFLTVLFGVVISGVILKIIKMNINRLR